MEEDYEIAPYKFLGENVLLRRVKKGDGFVFEDTRNIDVIGKTSSDNRKSKLFARMFSKQKHKLNDKKRLKWITK